MSTPYELPIEGHRITALGFNEQLTGPAVFFIHGITSSINFWVASQSDYFQRDVRWYSLSLPGHYPSRFPVNFSAEKLDAAHIADVLMAAVERLAPNVPVILIGHSTGGFAALSMAAHYSERIAAVASISGFAHGRWAGALAILQKLARAGLPGEMLFRFQMRFLTSNRLLYRASLRAYAKDWQALYANPGMEPTLDLIYPDAVHLSLDAMLHYFRRMPNIDITPMLSHVTAPTLVMTGDADPIVPPQQAHVIAQAVPNAQLCLLPGCGHLPMSERFDVYEQHVNEFVRQQIANFHPAIAV